MNTARLVVIDDDPDLQALFRAVLEAEGYRIQEADGGEEGLRCVRTNPPDLVLLDLVMPGVDGLEVCRRLRNDTTTREVPIIMVTTKGHETDVVLGLGLGADDYVIKPFNPRELVARVKAVLRRAKRSSPANASTDRLNHQGLVMDKTRHEVRTEASSIDLTPTEFRLLWALIAEPGRVFTRSQLIDQAIGDDAFVEERTIDVHVQAIRRKLAEHRDIVETIRGVGYRSRDEAPN